MRKRILLAAWLLCGLMLPSWGQTESKKNPRLLIDGCFFMETPSELNGAKLKMAVLKNEDVWGIERSGFFNGREKWAKGFENQRV